MAIRDDLKTLGYVVVGGFIVWKFLGDKIGAKLNPFSDKNVAYQGADALAKAAMGPKATISDIIPGINTTTATKTASSSTIQKLSVLPTQYAPYWFNADGTKRNTRMNRGGTVYGAYGQLMQITDAMTQAAAYVTDLGTAE